MCLPAVLMIGVVVRCMGLNLDCCTCLERRKVCSVCTRTQTVNFDVESKVIVIKSVLSALIHKGHCSLVFSWKL